MRKFALAALLVFGFSLWSGGVALANQNSQGQNYNSQGQNHNSQGQNQQ
jgi:hypothetical protein